MFDRSLKVRGLVALGTAVAATAIAAPLAAADPAPLFIPHTQTAQPRLGEHLNGSDRTWLSMRERTPRLGEGWSGSDRSWLASGPTGGRTAAPSDGFQWGDAGIGAATATALLLVLAGGAVAIRRRPSPAR
jgi:hypothetical protein